MNKLLLDRDFNLSDCEYLIEYNQDLKLNIKGNVTLNEYSFTNPKLELNLDNNSSLSFDKVNIVNKDTSIIINIKDNTSVNLNFLIINKGHNKIQITTNLQGNNSKCNVKVRAINQDSESNADIICDGIIYEKTSDNELIEDLKGLILHNDTIKISPNMLVKTNEVIANHLVTISSFNKDELFYLESKGLSRKKAEILLTESFTSIVNKELKSLEVNYE